MRMIQSELDYQDETEREMYKRENTKINSRADSVNNDVESNNINKPAEGEDFLTSEITPEDINILLNFNEVSNTEKCLLDNNLRLFDFDDYFTI
jgi:hypothetical protein